MAIIASVETAKNALDLTKRALEIANGIKNVELKAIILELKEEALTHKEEIITLRQRIAELEAEKKTEHSLIWNGTVYHYEGEDPYQEGAICPRCYDAERKIIRMKVDRAYGTRTPYWFCNNCKTSYE